MKENEQVKGPEIRKGLSDEEAYWENNRNQVVVLDQQSLTVLKVNPSFCRFFGKNEEYFLGKNILEIGSKKFQQFIGSSLEKDSWDGESYFHSYRDEKGKKNWHKWELQQNKDNTIYIEGKDITKSKQQVNDLYRIINYDEDTGLYSKFFVNEMKQIYENREYPFSVLYYDLDGLKVFNDTFGHKNGDKYLKLFSAFLRGILRDGEIIARLGGDEFIVLLPQVSLDKTVTIVERIKHFQDLINNPPSIIKPEDQEVLVRIKKNFNKLTGDFSSKIESITEPIFSINDIGIPLYFSEGASERSKEDGGKFPIYEDINLVIEKAESLMRQKKLEKRSETIDIFLNLMEKFFPGKKPDDAFKVMERLRSEKGEISTQKSGL